MYQKVLYILLIFLTHKASIDENHSTTFELIQGESTALTTIKVSYKDIVLVGAKIICNQNISLVSYLFESQLTVTPYIIADRIVVACKEIVGAAGDIES